MVSVLEDTRRRGFTPELIFDVGASDGAWTRLVKPVFPRATFVMMEPRPALQERLDTFCRSQTNCHVVANAVGAAQGEAVLTDWDTASTLLPVDAGQASQIRVPVTTLDRVSDRFGVPALVKLDVEGYEIEALRGATALFGHTEAFIIEVALMKSHERPLLHDVVAFMLAHGYFVYDVPGFIRRPFDGALGLVDLCFARADGQLRSSQTAW
jgi:FkbM family methyltransferase